MPENRYTLFKAEEFATDPYFQKWVLEEDELAKYFWENWIKKNPHKKEEIILAKKILTNIHFKKYEATSEDFIDVWNNVTIQRAIKESSAGKSRSFGKDYWLAAACISLLIIASSILYFDDDKITHSTGYNETAEVVLPDSSIVTLNSNSSISYNKEWEGDRSVYLKGEGFFSVKHTVDNRKFEVFANNVKVQVLGTEFGVKYRRGKTQVVLQSGRVKLEIKKTKNIFWPEENPKEIIMNPGELIEYSEEHKGLMRKKVVPEKYSAWTRNIMIFENISLAGVGSYIEDNFGYEVEFGDESIKKKMFSGKIENKEDIDLLIEVLQETFNLNIYKNETTILIKTR